MNKPNQCKGCVLENAKCNFNSCVKTRYDTKFLKSLVKVLTV